MKTFSLVNPFITGSLDTTVEAKNEITAAKTLYMKVSKYFKNNLPRFYFTVMDDNSKLYHFEVNERKQGKEVNFTIKAASMKKDAETKIKNVVQRKQKEQSGGKDDKFLDMDHDDSESDSDSDSSSDSYSPRRVPLYIDPIREFLYNPSYIIEVPDNIIIGYPYTYFPSLYLSNGYPIIWGTS